MAQLTSKIKVLDSFGNIVDVSGRLLDKYEPSYTDDAGDPQYYGFVDKDGNWYVQKITGGTITYSKGTTSFATNWGNRASLTYSTFDNVF